MNKIVPGNGFTGARLLNCNSEEIVLQPDNSQIKSH